MDAVLCEPEQASEELYNTERLQGCVAVARRGVCSFAEKARRVQAAGAIALCGERDTRERDPLAGALRFHMHCMTQAQTWTHRGLIRTRVLCPVLLLLLLLLLLLRWVGCFCSGEQR